MRETEDVLEQVVVERERQISKGYTMAHDDDHTLSDFRYLIQIRLTNNYPSREEFLQIAALSVAAIELIDRKY
jgi:hypothetical protein